MFAFVSPVNAHMLWLNPMDYTPEVGSTVEIGIGWGHRFPADRTDQEVKEDRVAAIGAVDPDGRPVELEKVAVDRYKLKIQKAGAYVVSARINPGFFTMTPEGRMWGNKKEIKDCVKCTNFHIEAKTVLVAGGDPRHLNGATGQTLDLIPLSDPRELKKGSGFEVSVAYQGKPLADAQVRAVYAGFEVKEEKTAAHQGKTAHQKGKHGHYTVETVTDADGVATIPVDRSGHWLIVLSYRPPYPDKATCDEYMHNVTYAFQVHP